MGIPDVDGNFILKPDLKTSPNLLKLLAIL